MCKDLNSTNDRDHENFEDSISCMLQLGVSGNECSYRTERDARCGNTSGPRDESNGNYRGQIVAASSESLTMPRARNATP